MSPQAPSLGSNSEVKKHKTQTILHPKNYVLDEYQYNLARKYPFSGPLSSKVSKYNLSNKLIVQSLL